MVLSRHPAPSGAGSRVWAFALPLLALLQACNSAPAPGLAVAAAQPPDTCGRPSYPVEAQMRNESGTVTLEFEIRPDGSVGQINVASSSGSAALDNASVAALAPCSFKPPKDGKPAMSTVQYKFGFEG